MKIIYDLGANNGDDIPYYLLKADFVVAVEANPVLCELINSKYRDEILAGRLLIENCVVIAEGECGEIDFYIHKLDHVLSQLPTPSEYELKHYEKVVLPSKNISSIIEKHGEPYYIKVDIEHYDAEILKALFRVGIFPQFISAESHSIEVFSLLATQGHYNAFKLVDGKSVPQVYSDRLIECDSITRLARYSFPLHSAGPFGDDVDGEWMEADTFLRVLALERLGWIDIHATRKGTDSAIVYRKFRSYLRHYLIRMIRCKIGVILDSIFKRSKQGSID